MVTPGSETWLRNFPSRYNPVATARCHQPYLSSITTTSTSSVQNQVLARDRYQAMKWVLFQVPSSDNLIRADTREGIPAYDLPNENDGFTIVRRYLYDVLTKTGWGISAECPAAIRATVEGWYGHGGYFKAQCAAEDGLSNLCPIVGQDGEGKEVTFDERLREKIRDCVRHESRVLLCHEDRLQDSISEADTCVDDATLDIIVQEKCCHDNDEKKDIHTTFRPSLELSKDSTATASPGDQKDNPDRPARPLFRSISARSSRSSETDTWSREELASSYRAPITPERRANPSSDTTHNVTVQVPALEHEQSRKKREPSRKDPTVVNALVAGRISTTDDAASCHKDEAAPDPSSQHPRQNKVPTASKHTRSSFTAPITNATQIELRLTHRKSVRELQRRLQTSRDTTCSITSVKSVRYDTLPECQLPPIKEQRVLVEATQVAKRAIALKLIVDEVRHLNHHERTKGNLLFRLFPRMGAKEG
jgi:hypothetical protein